MTERVDRGGGGTKGDVPGGATAFSEADIRGGAIGDGAGCEALDIGVGGVGRDGTIGAIGGVHRPIRPIDGGPRTQDAVRVGGIRISNTGRAEVQGGACVAGDAVHLQDGGGAGATGDVGPAIERGGCHDFGVVTAGGTGAVELQGGGAQCERGGVGELAGVAGGVVEDQAAGVDRRGAGVAIGTTEGERAGADLDQATRAGADDAGEAGALVVGSHADGVVSDGEGVRTFEAAEVVGVVSGDGEVNGLRAGSASVERAALQGIDAAEGEGAGIHERVASVQASAGEGLGVCSILGDAQRAHGVAVEGVVGGAVQRESGGIGTGDYAGACRA